MAHVRGSAITSRLRFVEDRFGVEGLARLREAIEAPTREALAGKISEHAWLPYDVYIDLSGWSPKYFPEELVRYANGQLKHKMLFGSDFPLIAPDRWIKDFKEAGFKPEVHDLILKQNAIRALKLAPAG